MDILHAFGSLAALFIAYWLGHARRIYREERWLTGVRVRLDAWDEADPLGDSSEVVEPPGSPAVSAPDPWATWAAGYTAGYRAASDLAPGIRERLAAGAEGGKEVERGKVLG